MSHALTMAADAILGAKTGSQDASQTSGAMLSVCSAGSDAQRVGWLAGWWLLMQHVPGSRFFSIAAYSEILLTDPASIERSSESQGNLHSVAWRFFLDLLVYRLLNCRVHAVSICKALAQELQALTRDASTGLFRVLRFLCYYLVLAVCGLFLCYYAALAVCYLCYLLMFIEACWRTKQFRQSRLSQ